MALVVDYESEGFPPSGGISNGHRTLKTTWDELLWSALTVGRPNRHYVFRHGTASAYEALFRLSMVRMALEQTSPAARRLRRTPLARTLDPSEKGAINYFLGLAVAKLFAARLLDAPWLLHLDVFRPLLNAVLAGRSRPDLVGQTTSGEWLSLECKGRLSSPDAGAKDRAKFQALRVATVNGVAPSFYLGGITYYRNDALQFFWRDPPQTDPIPRNAIEVTVEPDDWRHYYMPVLQLIRSEPTYLERMMLEPVLMPVQGADIELGIHPSVLPRLLENQWEAARSMLTYDRPAFPYNLDGIAVVAGPNWSSRFPDELEF